jgi:hypoxanthine-DNA glycosylase
MIQSFAPLARRNARLLILGSMPGTASLQAGQYYAHPRNAFWPIMQRYLHIPADTPYPTCVARMLEARIALWDVLESCHRIGSLDAQIDTRSLQPNTIDHFLEAYVDIRTIFFNGATAERLFKRLILPLLPQPSCYRIQRLPSTSPAHASLSFENKQNLWLTALNQLDIAMQESEQPSGSSSICPL